MMYGLSPFSLKLSGCTRPSVNMLPIEPEPTCCPVPFCMKTSEWSRVIRFAFSLLFVVLLAVPRILSQTNTTALTGTVTDATGALLPGATITLSSAASGNTLKTESRAKGEFSFTQVAPGTYQVRVSAPGFSEDVEQVELLVSTPLNLSFKLTVGSNEVVEVATNLAEINSTDATLGKAFNSNQVANLPYLANNVTYLLSLQPGVLGLDSGAQSGGVNTDSRTGIVNGARQDQTNITLDGVDNNDQIFGLAFNGALRSTRDSVEEFRVTTTNANADAGRSSGGQVSLVTKSGTNIFHGSAYEYYRGSATASNQWFNKQSELQSDLPNIQAKVLENTYGASLGFPIKKDRLFFFGAYEGFKQASDIPVGETVPSILGGGGLVTGNVTYQTCGAGKSTGCTNPTTLTLTPTDIAKLDGRASDAACATTTCYAPATNAASIAYFKQFPISNANGAGDGLNTGGYNFTSPAPIHQITNIARIDYALNDKQRLFVRGNLQSDNTATALQFPGGLADANTFGNSKGIAAGHTWTINDRMTNNLRYGLVRIGSASRGTANQPFVNFGPFNTLTASTTDNVYTVTTNNAAEDFTYVKGRHTLQAGGNFIFVSNAQFFTSPLLQEAQVTPNLLATAAIADQQGSFDPSTGACGADCAPVASAFEANFNNAIIANAGVIESATSGTEFKVQNNMLVPQGAGVVPTHTFNNLEQEYYLQDQWKVNNELTFTAGVRYVYLGVPDEKNGQEIAPTISLNTFFSDRANAAAAGTAYTNDISFRAAGAKNGQPNFWTPQKGNFAPRVAFAYSTKDNKTSVRGGFALAFDHFGSAVIDSYQSNPQSLLSLAQTNLQTYTDINSNPRFAGYHSVPAVAGATTSLQLPYTPAENAFTFDYSINDHQKTPYAETFNLTVQHEFPKNLSMTASYVGRLGRHLLQNLDVAMPTNLFDPTSGQTYYQAATAYRKMIDAGVNPATVSDSGYFHNLFPNFSYQYQAATATTPALYWYGAQAYFASLAANVGNETNTLFQADTNPGAAPSNQSFRFFYPQTSSVMVQSTTGVSNYNALQLSVRQSLGRGFEYDINYTLSHSLDEGSDPERNANGSVIINSFSPHQWYADSDFDVRHNLTANYILPFPIGRGQMLLNNGGWLDRFIGGFQLSGVVHYSTGFPFSAVASNVWGTNFAFNSNMVETAPIPTGGHHYDKVNLEETALKGITSAQANANLRFAYPGDAGQRNNFRSDGYLSVDDGLSKSFRTWREQQFKISAEVFNVINTNRFAIPQTAGDSPNFGVYQNAGNGTSTTSSSSPTSLLLSPRQMQFSGKYIF